MEQLVQKTCDYKQAYTQYGGLRPFGVAFLFAGWDVHFGYQVWVCARPPPSSISFHFLLARHLFSVWRASCGAHPVGVFVFFNV